MRITTKIIVQVPHPTIKPLHGTDDMIDGFRCDCILVHDARLENTVADNI